MNLADKGSRKKIFWIVVAMCIFGLGTHMYALETTYNRVDEIMDWGAATTKVIVNLQTYVDGKLANITRDTFSVQVKRIDKRVKPEPIEEGTVTITDAYISDYRGEKSKLGNYATLELKIGPTVSLTVPLNYVRSNEWIDCVYTIKQEKPITIGKKSVSDLTATTLIERFVPLVELFSLGSFTAVDEEYGEQTFSYADYKPSGKTQKPLIIWLHGGGEGGTDATIPLSANRACTFASEKTQEYFGGAFVYVPQAPTKWMDDGLEPSSGKTKTNPQSIYTRSLQKAIDKYVNDNPNIDKTRIYVGGCSNGGFMAVRLTIDYPDYYAASFPVCEGINDKYLSDADIETLKKTPSWFITSAKDKTLPAPQFTISLYDRLIKAGAENTYVTNFEKVIDLSGIYKNDKGHPYEYDGHWSWIYVYNNIPKLHVVPEELMDGKPVTFMEWLSAQSK